jgi:hypothetical protein
MKIWAAAVKRWGALWTDLGVCLVGERPLNGGALAVLRATVASCPKMAVATRHESR